MKTRACTTLAAILLLVTIAGCTMGNAKLAEMSASQIRDTFKIGVTTTADVRAVLGAPTEMGVQTVKGSEASSASDAKLVWYYRYQKMSARFFTPFVPVRPQDNLHGRLILGFDASNVLEHIDYYGDQ